MSDERPPGAGSSETTQEKSERLKAARLRAERDTDLRIDRAKRKSAARRKVLRDGKT